MRRRMLAVTALAILVTLGGTACDKGPLQRAGEKVDRATDQDKLIGKGPVEKAGKTVDNAVRDLRR